VKPAIFHPAARQAIRRFPAMIRRQLGKTILDLQKGHNLGMPLSRPVREVAVGVEELRVRDAAGIYRTFYFTRSKRGILIPHAFVKKTRKTPRHEIELARRRLKEMRDEQEQNDHRA
jgi:phage-related protein